MCIRKLSVCALAAPLLSLVVGCGTNPYGVAMKGPLELRHVSDDDLCYAYRYWTQRDPRRRSPQMVNEIRKRQIDCAATEAGSRLADTSAHRRIIGIIPGGDIQAGAGCSHYVQPANPRSDLRNALVFHWGLEPSDRPTMNILGKTVAVSPLTPYPEITLNERMELGHHFVELYRFGAISIRFDNTIRFVCPPHAEGGCEVTKFDGVLTVSHGGTTETLVTKGECGL